MTLRVHPIALSICRLSPTDSIPSWAFKGDFFSISKTPSELSIVCSQEDIPSGIKAERDWQALAVVGTLDFSLTGILAALAQPLANAKISIFAISTFDTDYILVKQKDCSRALEVLSRSGHDIQENAL